MIPVWWIVAYGAALVIAGIAGWWVARRDIAAGRIIEDSDDD